MHQHLSSEFKSEVETLSKVEHLNLVRFLGCLEHGDERIIVVEYVSNGTLRQHLDGTPAILIIYAIFLNRSRYMSLLILPRYMNFNLVT